MSNKKNYQHIEVYGSDDYSGMKFDKFEFYYGYETDWMFAVREYGKLVWSISNSDLLDNCDNILDDPRGYMLAGIGMYMQSVHSLTMNDVKLMDISVLYDKLKKNQNTESELAIELAKQSQTNLLEYIRSKTDNEDMIKLLSDISSEYGI